MASVTGIPMVDLSLFTTTDTAKQQDFVNQLGNAFVEVGFVAVINHGIPQELVKQFYEASYRFFSMSDEVKAKYEIPGLAGQRGYTSFGKEHAKHSKVGDLKEFFQIGQTIPPSAAIDISYPDNVSIEELPAFFNVGNDLYKAFESAGNYLLEAIALFLNLPQSYFEAPCLYGNSILRAIHYPPITQEPASAIRAEQHEDINLITLLVGASADGLQVLNKNNDWVDVRATGDAIVVNVGDMLQRLTNNYLKSTTHRVVNPPRDLWHTPRLSIPFFLHPQSTMPLNCLAQCVSPERPLAYSPITAGEYLDERLREIGLKK